MKDLKTVKISSISTGFLEVPGQIALNLYVQGCSLHCKDCHNPELQPFSGGTDISTTEILGIIKNKELASWICWLGGEPTEQPEGFKAFNKIFKKEGYGICLYTGKKFSELGNLLDNVDLVIDGPWEGTKVTESASNQKAYYNKENWHQVDFNKIKEILNNEL